MNSRYYFDRIIFYISNPFAIIEYLGRIFKRRIYFPTLNRLEYLVYCFFNIYRKRPEFYKVVNKNLLSVIIVTYNSADYLDNALQIFENDSLGKDCEVIIIDNNSRNKEYLRKYEKRNKYKVVYNVDNLMFTRAVNQGMRMATGGYVLLLSPDVSWDNNLRPDPIIRMFSAMESNKHVGVVGIVQKVLNSGKTIFSEGRIINKLTGRQVTPSEVFVKWRDELYCIDMLERNDRYEYERTLWVWGSIFMIKRELINQIGFLPYNQTCVHGFSEIIYCQIAAYRKWKMMVVKNSYAYHPYLIKTEGGCDAENPTVYCS